VKRVVVDSNILFSALLKEGQLAAFLTQKRDSIQFITSDYLVEEIHSHWYKLVELSSLSESQLNVAWSKLIKTLHFVNPQAIDPNVFAEAFRICKQVDEKDTIFVAIALDNQCNLLTGDKKLRNGLERQGYFICISIKELLSTTGK
jgi:putative PIN family toxin of toxin-antitoxin system